MLFYSLYFLFYYICTKRWYSPIFCAKSFTNCPSRTVPSAMTLATPTTSLPTHRHPPEAFWCANNQPSKHTCLSRNKDEKKKLLDFDKDSVDEKGNFKTKDRYWTKEIVEATIKRILKLGWINAEIGYSQTELGKKAGGLLRTLNSTGSWCEQVHLLRKWPHHANFCAITGENVNLKKSIFYWFNSLL